ncbi:hypothetical protein B9Z55_018670 [Caenorhabditis nigoni]|uniref:Uncharacterized protein n=1 Tax=Caenorhabditis nigoni TaxID=1611254 RepID=A0A2G5TF90_9PELO|nr:hypothetical protein B9Z55_018670 [Caenorhabditis nigoni]
MALLAGLREEELKKFLSEEAKILTVRHLERFQLQITAVSRTGKIVRGVLDQKSRITREWLLREKYETPYIVELPNDHPVDTERVRYSVSLVIRESCSMHSNQLLVFSHVASNQLC